MRTALLLSGTFRNGIECSESIKSNLINLYNTDVFIDYTYNPYGLQECDYNQLVDTYNPTSIVYEPSSDEFSDLLKIYENKVPTFNKYPEVNEWSLFAMWYKLKRVNDLKSKYEIENGFKYDIVIKARFDIKILEPINLIQRDNTIHIPIGWDHRGGYNDIFAYGDSKSMDYYCSLFDYMIPYLEQGTWLHPESLLKTHLDKSDIVLMRNLMKISLRDMKIHELEYRIK